MSLGQPSLKGRALRLLSGREHSRAELERKLTAHAATPGELAHALDELQAKGFIDERRVLESLIHRRAEKLGAARIQHELQGKGLDADAVLVAVEGLRATEVERAQAVWRKKFGPSLSSAGAPQTIGSDLPQTIGAAERNKQMRFLAARGFTTDTIRRVIAASLDNSAPEQD